jgi:hypothetical protein
MPRDRPVSWSRDTQWQMLKEVKQERPHLAPGLCAIGTFESSDSISPATGAKAAAPGSDDAVTVSSFAGCGRLHLLPYGKPCRTDHCFRNVSFGPYR